MLLLFLDLVSAQDKTKQNSCSHRWTFQLNKRNIWNSLICILCINRVRETINTIVLKEKTADLLLFLVPSPQIGKSSFILSTLNNFTVNISHLHYNVFQRGWEAISGQNYEIAQNCLAYMLDFIAMQISRVNRAKGYSHRNAISITVQTL